MLSCKEFFYILTLQKVKMTYFNKSLLYLIKLLLKHPVNNTILLCRREHGYSVADLKIFQTHHHRVLLHVMLLTIVLHRLGNVLKSIQTL